MRWLNKLVNKQVLRTFSFLPALGWREVPVNDVKHLFKGDLNKIKKNDRAYYRHTIDGKLVSFIVAFYGNENKKDTNYVKSILNDAFRRYEEVMDNKKGA